MGRWLDRVERQTGRTFETYEEAWRWSCHDLEGFWASVWDEFAVRSAAPYQAVLADPAMPGATWFPGSRLSYAEHALRLEGRNDDDVVVIGRSQTRDRVELTADELRERVGRAQAGLAALGVRRGDRVVAMVPNIPEALVGFLATAGLGATWSSCSPELGARAVIDRFAQLDPSVLIAVSSYRYGSRAIDRRADLATIRVALPGLRATVRVPYPDDDPDSLPGSIAWGELLAAGGASEDAVGRPEAVDFDHPLAILFSSGTTGPPKAIVHGHGGILLEHAKALGLHTDLGPGDRFFWHSSTSWMMWSYLVSGLLVGATVVLFDGDPTSPDLGLLWRLAAEEGITYFGVSAPFLMACRRSGVDLAEQGDLSTIRGVGSTGAALPAEGFRWVDRELGPAVQLGSLSGGTDLCTGFLGPSPLLPVRAGQISCRMLGASVEAFDDDGQALIGRRGELVITKPMLSMPLRIWGDADGSRYRSTWFDRFPGVWCHGDWLTVTEEGACVVSGRSDATLNRGGVRLGTAEFYAVIEELPEVRESLVVHLEDPTDGIGELLLFVVVAPEASLDESLRARIAEQLRRDLSPRHVPDDIVAVPAIPQTFSGKRLEVPVKRILMGAEPAVAAAWEALRDPAALDAFVAFGRQRRARSPGSPTEPSSAGPA